MMSENQPQAEIREKRTYDCLNSCRSPRYHFILRRSPLILTWYTRLVPRNSKSAYEPRENNKFWICDLHYKSLFNEQRLSYHRRQSTSQLNMLLRYKAKPRGSENNISIAIYFSTVNITICPLHTAQKYNYYNHKGQEVNYCILAVSKIQDFILRDAEINYYILINMTIIENNCTVILDPAPRWIICNNCNNRKISHFINSCFSYTTNTELFQHKAQNTEKKVLYE